jgi:galactofuranosylgalactofuranosylrhamnosyl-N-acetylglucosaminyl-diphospho-decaprenol beta-1,5/1,6-galactofuranosyltransferase
MPGAAVWHVPWTDKNDALDWQAYFHHRNRFVAALLHSPFPHGGRLIRESMNHQIKHLIAMQYSTVELRLMAMNDVLDGPGGLHAQLLTRLGDVRDFRKGWDDATTSADPDSVPPVRHSKPRKRGDTSEIPPRLSQLASAVIGGIRQFRPARAMASDFPEANLPAMDARWYHLATLDSAIVSMPDGTSAAFYKRQPEQFKDLLKRNLEVHERFYRDWQVLAKTYRDALGEITSPEVWEKTFADSMKDAALKESK